MFNSFTAQIYYNLYLMYHLLNDEHLMIPYLCIPGYTDLAMSTVTQRLSISYTGTLPLLRYYLNQLSADVVKVEFERKVALRVFNSITIFFEAKMVVVEASRT